ncbi:MAG: NPCBM/NEW2 domain-containing protein [Dysgonamonadaceae bacterium]|nr:NPCBM/NEW2 domain-containing protein [Dysgonamonadaceae bacterium]
MLLALTCFIVTGCSFDAKELYLSDSYVEAFSSGWGKAKADSSVTGTPLMIDSVLYLKGIGTHAISEASFILDGQKGRFKAFVGVDDNAQSDSASSIIFYVLTNKGVAFNSDVMKKGDKPKPIDIELKGVTELFLLVESTSDGIGYDHADWADAKFIVRKAPEIKLAEVEEPYILTPPPAAKPRINGAKIVGASAGKPFMFNIATTGECPLTFTAENLPEGLMLDVAKGLITGVASRKGNYLVPVTAKNSRGECRDTIEIVIGGGLALTPHMGWNSWYCHQTRVTQDIMQRSAKAMYDKGLINFGYTYVNIDDGWEVKANSDDSLLGGAVRNADGTLRTNKNFPDMRGMVDYIHNLGLKAGLYSSPGRTTCAGYEGSLGHEDQDVKTYCEWGFDFLKYDWCSYSNEVKHPVSLEDLKKPYILINSIIKRADRDIVLNLCQYGMGEVWKWGKEVGGHSWRTAGDIGWITPELINSMFTAGFFQETIRQYSGPDGWNDPDYLLFGSIWNWQEGRDTQSPMSPSEQYTCMTLWCMMAAPLIFSGELISLDDFTLNILCNAEVIDINQDKLGKPGYGVHKQDFTEIWKKELHDGTSAIAIFNKSPIKSTVTVDWKAIGYSGKEEVRDIWRQQDLGTATNAAEFEIPRHGCMLLKVK